MEDRNTLYGQVESLKNMLTSRATGGHSYDSAYKDLRLNLVRNSLIKSKLPSFVRTYRTLDEFWGFIKQKYAHYSERREFISQGFDPVLTYLETSPIPSDSLVAKILQDFRIDTILSAWQKALDRRNDDPEGAVTSARTLLEEVCKHILDDRGVNHTEKEDLPRLYCKVANALNLSPSQHTEKLFRQVLGGCHAVIEGLGAIRNKLGDAHGKGTRGYKPAPRHAHLAVNLAGSLSVFLIETHNSRKVGT